MAAGHGPPQEVRNRILSGLHYDNEEREKVFQTFVEKFIKLNSKDTEEFSKTILHLDKVLDRKVHRPDRKHRVKKLSNRKRKELGLYVLGKKSLKFCEVLPLHRLWKEYMTNYMNLEELSRQNWKNAVDDPNFDQVSLKLYRADYHGCHMKILKSGCPSYVGVSGIVVMETKNCFKLLGCDNVVRTIPKSTSVFMFKLCDFEFTFFGKNLCVRPAERSSRKLKTIYTSDLQL